MDRLEKLKGYKDKLSKDDCVWLINELTEARAGLKHLRELLATCEGKREKMASELEAMKAPEAEFCRVCLARSEDHAGWCPRR